MFLATVRHIIDDLFIYTCVMFLATRLSQMFRDHHVCLHRTVAVCTQGASGPSLNFLVTLANALISNGTEPYRKLFGSTHCTMEPAMRARTMERDMPQMQGSPTKKGVRCVQRMQETLSSRRGGKLEGLLLLARWISLLQDSWLLDTYDAEGKQKVPQAL